jgi:predicted AlkP superfamily pyrophosphatase or phosphodiesterase
MAYMKYIFISCLILLTISTAYSQEIDRPKLVVGIVIDQMRYDYLNKYEKYYGEDGFKRIMKGGSNFTFTHYNYVPTYTGPGHASIYTGSVPYYNGIISNDWYSRKSRSFVNCVQDDSIRTIGENTKEGQASPKRLLTTTISDQMKIATNGKARVYSVSLKDRAAILPGGHTPDEVFWYSPESGKFITSSYYSNSLPGWVNDFNGRNIAGNLFKGEWDLLLPEADYALSSPDNAPWEDDVFSEGRTSFPHSFSKVMDKKYDLIRSTPFGNELLLQFAESLIENEKPGSGDYTDFLAISFSSTDFIGHAYGPNSVEIQDAFIRMDRQLAELLSTLDKKVGKGNYILFLTADHAVSETEGFLRNMDIPAGSFDSKMCEDSLKAFSKRKFGTEDLIENFSNHQVYLNKEIIKEKHLTTADVEDEFGEFLQDEFTEIEKIFLRHNLGDLSASRVPYNYILNGFNTERSGNIEFELKPNYLPGNENYGTTHGAAFPYDTHVPLILYGWNIPAKQINSPVYVVDIAATICNLLGITEPTGCIGIPVLDK